ncbi:MAG: hypothetical protein ACFN3A_03120 [Candidatus Nanosyncoccus sp.]|jgi:hypothetical protein
MIFGFLRAKSEKAIQSPFCRLSQFKINGTKKKFLRFMNSFRSTGLIYFGDEARENEWFFDKITDEYPELVLRISRLKLKPNDNRSIPILLDMFMGPEAYYRFDESDLPPVLLCHWHATQKDRNELLA